MNSPPNFSLIASTKGLDQGSCCGPFGLGGAAGAAGFAPGGGGGGFGTAALGSPAGFAGGGGTGFGGSAAFSAGLSVCWLSFCSSATSKSRKHKDVDSTTSLQRVSTPTVTFFLSAQQKIVTQRG